MFTKKDLKNGMVVETRENRRYIVIGDCLLSDDGFLYLSEYDDNLLDVDGKECSIFDIMKVFDVVNELSSLHKDTSISTKVLFDRNTPTEQLRTNNDKTKYMCKEFAKIYDLDESKLYNHLLRIIYNATGNTMSITNFDIEKCSDLIINKAICELGKDCSTYFIMKNTEKD